MKNHLDRESLAMHAYGLLPPEEEAAARAHVAECRECRAEWNASRGEAASVKGAFEPETPARARLAAWWPAAAGFAAALLGGLLLSKDKLPVPSHPPAAERALHTSPTPVTPEVVVRAEWAGTRYRIRGNAEWTLDEGSVLLSNRGQASAAIESGSATVDLLPGSEIYIQSESGEIRVLCCQGSGRIFAHGSSADMRAGDAAAVVPGEAPTLLRGSEDADSRLRALRQRVVALERAAAGLPASMTHAEAPESVGEWLGKEASQGRMVGSDRRAGEELGRLWTRKMRELELSAADLHAGTFRERVLSGYLDGRGCPLSPAQQSGWQTELRAHETAWALYTRGRNALPVLDRGLAAARVVAGRAPRYAALLDATQRQAAAELDPAFRDWRRGFVPVFEVVVGIGGPEKALELVAAMGGGMPERAKEIERELLDACLVLHRSADPADPASEQAALIELLIRTRDRLVNDAGIAPERANSLLVNFVDGANK